MKELIKKHFPQFKEAKLLEEILTQGKLMSFKEGDVLVRKDSYVKVVPLVCSGIVKVLQEGEEHDVLMYYIERGESCIMSISACFKNEKSKVKAVIEEDAEILVIPSSAVAQWYSTYPSWNQFITSLYSKRFLNLLDGFNSVVYDKIETRIATYLQQKANLLDTNVLKITHRKIAEDLGKAREVISRILKVLEDEGKIELGRGKITIVGL